MIFTLNLQIYLFIMVQTNYSTLARKWLRTPRNKSRVQPPHSTMYLWDASSNIPQWMKDYFQWHVTTRAQLSLENWKQTKYMILHCEKKANAPERPIDCSQLCFIYGSQQGHTDCFSFVGITHFHWRNS